MPAPSSTRSPSAGPGRAIPAHRSALQVSCSKALGKTPEPSHPKLSLPAPAAQVLLMPIASAVRRTRPESPGYPLGVRRRPPRAPSAPRGSPPSFARFPSGVQVLALEPQSQEALAPRPDSWWEPPLIPGRAGEPGTSTRPEDGQSQDQGAGGSWFSAPKRTNQAKSRAFHPTRSHAFVVETGFNHPGFPAGRGPKPKPIYNLFMHLRQNSLSRPIPVLQNHCRLLQSLCKIYSKFRSSFPQVLPIITVSQDRSCRIARR